VVTATRQPSTPPVLRVTVSGGGPGGLVFGLLLDDLMSDRAAITIYDRRWIREVTDHDISKVAWKVKGRAASRRQQVVTIQSRQWSKLSPEIQERLFGASAHTEMWPTGPDSVEDLPPRNIRIAYLEDQLLALANERSGRIRLVPESFNPATAEGVSQPRVLALCEGSRSRTRDYFAARFGAPDTSMYALGAQPVQDVVLGQRTADGSFSCSTHDSLFLPALLKKSPSWARVEEGLRLFGVTKQNLTAVTCFRFCMVQRPRFTAQLFPRTATRPGTYGFLLGDAGNAIHIWPGRGLRSSGARCGSRSR
jgi:hypothetical protein